MILVISIPFCSSGADDNREDLVKLADDAAIWRDPALSDPLGILPGGTVVFANAYSSSQAGEVIEIVFCQDYIIRYAYISVMSVWPLSPSERSEYSLRASEGIIFKPGVSLINVELSVPPSPAEAVQEPSAVPAVEAAPAAAFETALPSPVTESTPEPVAESASSAAVPPDADVPSETAAPTEAPVNMSGSVVKLIEGTALYNDPEMTDILGYLKEDLHVYVNADIFVSGRNIIEVVFCRDFIIRYAYVPASVSAPADEETDDDEYIREGMLFKPGVILSNAELSSEGPSPVSTAPDPSAP